MDNLQVPFWVAILVGLLLLPLLPFVLWWIYAMQKKQNQFYILQYEYNGESLDTFCQGPVDHNHLTMLKSHPDISNVSIIASGSKENIDKLIETTKGLRP